MIFTSPSFIFCLKPNSTTRHLTCVPKIRVEFIEFDFLLLNIRVWERPTRTQNVKKKKIHSLRTFCLSSTSVTHPPTARRLAVFPPPPLSRTDRPQTPFASSPPPPLLSLPRTQLCLTCARARDWSGRRRASRLPPYRPPPRFRVRPSLPRPRDAAFLGQRSHFGSVDRDASGPARLRGLWTAADAETATSVGRMRNGKQGQQRRRRHGVGVVVAVVDSPAKPLNPSPNPACVPCLSWALGR